MDPSASDVLFGRGRGIYSNSGNVAFLKLVEMHKVMMKL